MATVKNMTRPAMMEVLKDSTRCLAQMNKNKCLKLSKKGIVRTSKKPKQRKKAEKRKRGQTC